MEDREDMEDIERLAREKVEAELQAQKADREKKKVKREEMVASDPKDLMKSAIPELVVRAIELARKTKNLTQLMGVVKEMSDRVYGKPEQAVTAKVEVSRTDVDMREVASMLLFAMREAKESGAVIEGEFTDNVALIPTPSAPDNLD